MDTPYVKENCRNTAIRLIKEKPGICGMPEVDLSADFECSLVTDPGLHYETDGEIVLYVNHFILKDACLITVHVKTADDCRIQHVICEGSYIAFEQKEDGCHFTIEISGLQGPTRSLYAHTLLREDGVTLRVEENDLGRCAGKYSRDTYPETQICAAVHYAYAAREALKMMGIPRYLHENHLGYMLLLGFETCNEIHSDYPPHWHIIFRWPYFCGSQAPHIYLDEDGRMTKNITYIDGIRGVSRTYEMEEWCNFVDMYGQDVMAVCVLPDGGMKMVRPNGKCYKLHAYDPENGVLISCEGANLGTAQVTNDTTTGKLVYVWRDQSQMQSSYCESVYYDPLLGKVINIKKEALNTGE